MPENGYGSVNGQTAFTHGIQFGVARASTAICEATRTLLGTFAQGNPELKQAGQPQDVRIAQRSALGVALANQSAVGKTELIGVYHVSRRRQSLLLRHHRARGRGVDVRSRVRKNWALDQAQRRSVAIHNG